MAPDLPRTALLTIALTGGIASGKTAAANEFRRLGAAVIDTDQIARDIVEPGQPAFDQIVAEFGRECVDEHGQLNRRKLREIVFADAAKRKRLEAITHPAIRAELLRLSALATGPYLIHVIPLLAEGGRASDYERVVVVDCDEDLQLQRLMQRDQSNEMQARSILAAQATRSQRLAIATDVVENNGSLENFLTEVRQLHARYLRLLLPT